MSDRESLVGRRNAYRCEACGYHIITIDRDEGVTPFMLVCLATPECTGRMFSNFYIQVPDGEPEFEWRKPTAKEYKKMSPDMKEHIDMGGLDVYKIERETDEKRKMLEDQVSMINTR